MLIAVNQRLPHTVSKQINGNNEKQDIFEERSLIVFPSTPRSRTSYHASTDWVL